MLRNRREPASENRRSEKEWKQYELQFDLYVKKRWYYIGGNHEHHIQVLRHMGYDPYEITQREETQCYLCERPLNKRRIFYIKQYSHSVVQPIGRCCSSAYLLTPNDMVRILPRKQKTD
jgi:hypothetical protein